MSTDVTSSTKTYMLNLADGKIMHNLRLYYSSLKMIGRHFVVYAEDMPKHKRQYTICNAMIPDVKTYLMGVCESPDAAAKSPISESEVG